MILRLHESFLSTVHPCKIFVEFYLRKWRTRLLGHSYSIRLFISWVFVLLVLTGLLSRCSAPLILSIIIFISLTFDMLRAYLHIERMYILSLYFKSFHLHLTDKFSMPEAYTVFTSGSQNMEVKHLASSYVHCKPSITISTVSLPIIRIALAIQTINIERMTIMSRAFLSKK